MKKNKSKGTATLTKESYSTRSVLVEVLKNLNELDEDGYFTIQVGGQEVKARQLG